VTLDNVAAAQVVESLREYYQKRWPRFDDRYRRLGQHQLDHVIEPVLIDWAVAYLMAVLPLEDTPEWRRLVRSAMTAEPGSLPVDEAVEEDESVPIAVDRILQKLRAQPSLGTLNSELTGTELRGALSVRGRERWTTAAPKILRQTPLTNFARLAHRLRTPPSPVEALAAVGEAFPELSWAARTRFLQHLGVPMSGMDGARHRALRRLGWLAPRAGQERGAAGNPRRDGLIALSRVADVVGVRAPQLGLLIGLLTGSIPEARRAGVALLCGPKPHCPACPARPQCLYPALRGVEDEAAPAGQTTLAPEFRDDDPRDKLWRDGPDRLSDAELLSVVLGRVATGESPVETARQLMAKHGDWAGLDSLPLTRLRQALPGVRRGKLLQLKAALAIGRRWSRLKLRPGLAIRSSEDVFRALALRYRDTGQEVFQLLALTSKNEVIDHLELSRGTLNASLVHPREAYREAIVRSASAVIFVHNHPSGDPTPSDADQQITDRLRDAARTLAIRFLDHIILGRSSYYSFTDGHTTTSDPTTWGVEERPIGRGFSTNEG